MDRGVIWTELPSDIWMLVIRHFLSRDLPSMLALGATSGRLHFLVRKVTSRRSFRLNLEYLVRLHRFFGRSSNLLVGGDGICRVVSPTGIFWSFAAKGFLQRSSPTEFPFEKHLWPFFANLVCIGGQEMVGVSPLWY